MIRFVVATALVIAICVWFPRATQSASNPDVAASASALAAVHREPDRPDSPQAGKGESENPIYALAASLVLLLIGAGVKFRQDRKTQRLKDLLARTNDQLQFLYGPLFAATAEDDQAWRIFEDRYCVGRTVNFEHGTEDDKHTWRLWMTKIFLPLGQRMVELMVARADLMEGDQYPDSFKELLRYNAVYRTIQERCEAGDYSVLAVDGLTFPEGLHKEVAETFVSLKARQLALINTLDADAKT